jgi:hypothetical protein
LSEITPPGSFGLAVIAGKTGKLVRLGQDIVDGRKTTYTHAFFVLDKGEVIEAEPGGAEINPISKYVGREDVLFSDKPVQQALNFFPWANRADLEGTLRSVMVERARGLEGISYNYLDYVAIGLEHFNIDVPFVRNRVRREDRMICSQLVDYIYDICGIHLFNDGRVSQDVTPGDLEQYALAP